MKKVIITLSIIGIIVCVFFVSFYFFIISGAFSIFMSNPPKPEITYGEFPFALEYEIDGVNYKIEDTIVCEFDGFKSLGTAGKYRQWKTFLKSGNEYVTLLDLTSLNEINEYGHVMQELYFYYGNAEYYMGDENRYMQRDAQSFEEVCYKCQRNDGGISHSAYSAEKAYEKYKIKLIKWECESPIKNTFK